MLDKWFASCLALQELVLSLNTVECPAFISHWNFALWTVRVPLECGSPLEGSL